MRISIFAFVLFHLGQLAIAQPNCQLYQDSSCKKACEISIEAAKDQGSRYSQELFDQVIELCPSFAYAYFEKSAPYLKKGLFVEWKELMDQAVALDSSYLLNRGTNQVQFIRNYQGGLNDLNLLYEKTGRFDIGYNPSGEYHGQLIRAICYQKLGYPNKAIEIIEELFSQSNYSQGLYDYLYLGIAYLEVGELDKAKKAFDMQNLENVLAETYYYEAMVYERRNQIPQAIIQLEESAQLYKKENSMYGIYYHHIVEIHSSDIEKALVRLSKSY